MTSRLCVAVLIAAVLLTSVASAQTPALQKITINYPARSGGSWPMFIAKEGGYYQKYGLDVNLVFGQGNLGVVMIVSGEAAMTNSSMEQAMQASSKDPGALISAGSMLNKGVFALMAVKGINSVKDLKGKRIAVSSIGDAPYNYTIALLAKSGLKATDIQWVPSGTDVTSRAVFLTTGRADAALLTAPAYFKVEAQGYKNLANLSDYSDIYASSVYLFYKKTLTANPKLPELIIKAQAEAIKRFYEDKPFAIKAFLAMDDKADPADIARVYDLYAKGNAYERVPFVLAGAIKSVVDQADAQTATAMRSFDFKTVVDNSTVDRLVKEGFFEKLFGNGIKSEEERKSKLALR
ncbi:MAG TPA: ABC transporter substrate-binding protein [Terriglobia bacterium]|nr:ABC transporter substrate-binding protein [Terriglobia bacterium]